MNPQEMSELAGRRILLGVTGGIAPQLFEELGRIRVQGYGVDDEEASEGMRCVAAPVMNAYGEPVAGLSVSGPSFRLGRARIADVGAQVRELAAEATKAMGG